MIWSVFVTQIFICSSFSSVCRLWRTACVCVCVSMCVTEGGTVKWQLNIYLTAAWWWNQWQLLLHSVLRGERGITRGTWHFDQFVLLVPQLQNHSSCGTRRGLWAPSAPGVRGEEPTKKNGENKFPSHFSRSAISWVLLDRDWDWRRPIGPGPQSRIQTTAKWVQVQYITTLGFIHYN